MKIAVISDTHGLLRPELIAQLAGCDRILHAGDVGNEQVLDRLSAIAPIAAVLGNCDANSGLQLLRRYVDTIDGLTVRMAHKLDWIGDPVDADIIITGHTHRYEERTENGRLYLNPGSCGPMRFSGTQATYAFLYITDGKIKVEKRLLSS